MVDVGIEKETKGDTLEKKGDKKTADRSSTCRFRRVS